MAADIASALASWSTTEGSNSPAGSTAISTNLDDNLRMIQAVVRTLAALSTVASASSVDLGAEAASVITISGTTTITSFGTVSAGIWKWVVFSGALTLTHNATSLILPTGANITTAAGDCAMFVSAGSGNWRCLSYMKANGGILGALVLSDGTVSSPGMQFSSDSNTGIYRSGADAMELVAGGTSRATINTSGVTAATLTATTGTITTLSSTTATLGTVKSDTLSPSSGTSVGITMANASDSMTLKTTYLNVDPPGSGTVIRLGVNQGTTFTNHYAFSEEAFTVGDDSGDGPLQVRFAGASPSQLSSKTSNGALIWGQNEALKIGCTAVGSTSFNVMEARSDADGTPNLIFRIRADGAVYADGAYSGSGADYAEAFLFTGEQPQPGDPVTLDGDRVRIAVEGDDLIGVVSERACAVGDAQLLEQGGVPVGIVGKLRVNQGRPVAAHWRPLGDGRYLVK